MQRKQSSVHWDINAEYHELPCTHVRLLRMNRLSEKSRKPTVFHYTWCFHLRSLMRDPPCCPPCVPHWRVPQRVPSPLRIPLLGPLLVEGVDPMTEPLHCWRAGRQDPRRHRYMHWWWILFATQMGCPAITKRWNGHDAVTHEINTSWLCSASVKEIDTPSSGESRFLCHFF